MTDPSPQPGREIPTPTSLAGEAIEKALLQEWDEAVRINTAILKQYPDNIDALNRLAYAYFKLGDPDRAKRYYLKVTRLDEYNSIATKNLNKLTSGKVKGGASTKGPVSPLMFLEEPGKTKIIALTNVAPERVLATLTTGQEVVLKAKRHVVEIRDSHNVYLGALPDDLSFRLIKFLAGGNVYHTVVKSIGKNQLTVFLREVSRGKRFSKQPSFVSSAGFLPFDRERAKTGPDVTPTGEEEEEEVPPEEH